MRFTALVLLALVAGAFGAVKYAENYQGQIRLPARPVAAGAIGGVGTQPESALEWFYYTGPTSCYVLWSTSSTACGAVPVAGDDVVLGRGISPTTTPGAGTVTSGQEYTGVTGTPNALHSLFFSFNSPRLNCPAVATTYTAPYDVMASACAGMTPAATPPSPRVINADVATLTIWSGRATTLTVTTVPTTSRLAPIVLTGYPVITGTFTATAPSFTVTSSSRLTVRTQILFRQTNTALYGSGFGVSLGGQDPGVVDISGAGTTTDPTTGTVPNLGNQAFSTTSSYGTLARFGARNGLFSTDDEALTWFIRADVQTSLAPQLSKTGAGFIVETPSILVDSCAYAVDGTRCLGGFAATEIQGPNLYIQPVSAASLATDAAVVNAALSGTGRVNITIGASSVLFTSSTVYINADFRIQAGGALAFCEPQGKVPTTTAINSVGFGNQVANPDTSGTGTYNSLTPACSATACGVSFTGAPQQAWCAPIATNAYDWFGVQFTSVKIINENPVGVLTILYSTIAPNVAKLALSYGPLYTVPIQGNVSITAGTTPAVVTAPLGVSAPLALTDSQGATGPDLYTGRFLGLLVPVFTTNADDLTKNSFATTYDCASPLIGTGDTSAATPSAATPANAPEIYTAVDGARCRGHPIPSRFSFFGQSLIQGGGLGSLLQLTQFDLLATGDGSANSTLTFSQAYQLCGVFGARQNAILNFPNGVTLGGRATTFSNVRRFGQSLTTWQANRAAAPATASPTTIHQASTANPSNELKASTTLAPLVPSESLTCTPALLDLTTIPPTAGSNCFVGTYSYLYTGPTAGAVRPVIFQVNCVGGACGSTDGTRVSVVDPGCYTTFPTGTAATVTLANTTAAGGGVRGFCQVPPTATITAGTAGLTQVTTACPPTAIVGLNTWPASTVNSTVGQLNLVSGSFVAGTNVTLEVGLTRVQAGLTVQDTVDVESAGSDVLTATVASRLTVVAGSLLAEGGSITTEPLSTFVVNSLGSLFVTSGSIGSGSFVINGVASFYGLTSSIVSNSRRTDITGTGVITYGGVTSTTGSVGVFSQVTTVVNGSLSVDGQYTQTARAITVTGSIGTTTTGRLTLLSGGSLVFHGGFAASQALGSTQQFQVIVGDSASGVVISSGNTTTATSPLLITAVNATAVGVQIFGTLQSVNVPITLAANTLVNGTLGSATSIVQIGSPLQSNSVTLTGFSAAIAGSFRLYPNSQLINLGNSTVVAAGTAVDAVASSSQTPSTAIINNGTLVLAGTFTPGVDVLNAGTVVLSSSQSFTIGSGRSLRLFNGTVSGAGQLVITGSLVAETGVSSIAVNTVNNGVITVNQLATLVVTSCLSGTGSIGGNGVVIYEGQNGCNTNGQFQNLVLTGNATANGGLTIITGQLSGAGTFTAGTGYISINNNSTGSLTVTGTPTVGAASATNVVTVSGSVTVTSPAILSLGQAVVGIRDPVTFAVNSNGVVFSLTSGALKLLSSLLVPSGALFRTAGTVSGGSLQVAGALELTGVATFSGVSVLIASGGRVNATSAGSLVLTTGTSFVVSQNATFGGFAVTVNTGANFTFGGNFTGITTISGPVLITSNVVVPAGVRVTFNSLVTCAPGVTVVAFGQVNFVGTYSGCVVSGNVQGNPSAAPGTSVTTFVEGSLLLQPGSASLTIPANVTVLVIGATIITCSSANPATPCTIVVDGNLTVPFFLLCNNGRVPDFRNISGSCGAEGASGAFLASTNVVITINGVFQLVSGNANNLTASALKTQDMPTYPVGTVDSLVLTSTARTVIVTTGNNVNPLIVRQRLQLGGVLEVRTLTFVPLRPVVIIRLANTTSTITGSFSRVLVTQDEQRSSHNFAWNLGFPSVRVVGRDVILDPNGNGNSAAGVVPSFVVALFAVLAALYVRN